MSAKPEAFTTEEVDAQVAAMIIKKDERTIYRDLAAARWLTIQTVVNENDALVKKTKELIAESVNLYVEEWTKIPELYPEVRFGIVQKTLDLLTPLALKKKQGAPVKK